MKFIVTFTSYYDDDYPSTHNSKTINLEEIGCELVVSNDYDTIWTVEINSIEDLCKFKDSVGFAIIINPLDISLPWKRQITGIKQYEEIAKEMGCDGHLEIYNDYRE